MTLLEVWLCFVGLDPLVANSNKVAMSEIRIGWNKTSSELKSRLMLLLSLLSHGRESYFFE